MTDWHQPRIPHHPAYGFDSIAPAFALVLVHRRRLGLCRDKAAGGFSRVRPLRGRFFREFPATQRDESVVGDRTTHLPAASPPRLSIPALAPLELGLKGPEELAPLWLSLLWWDQTGVLPIPKKGRFERKAECRYKKLARGMNLADGDTTDGGKIRQTLESYFNGELKGVATFRMRAETRDFSPANLAKLAQGPDAVILRLRMIYSNDNPYTCYVVLESMTPQGDFAARMFGLRITGKFRPVPASRKPDRERWEFVLADPRSLPEHYRKNDPRFFMAPLTMDAAFVIEPFVFAIPAPQAN